MSYRAVLTGVILFLALLLLAGAAFRLTSSWTIDPDASAYVGLARSLSEGEGYTFGGVPHTKYPPLFPGLLTLLIAMSGPADFLIMQAGLVVCWVMVLALAFLLFSGRGLAPSRFVEKGLPKTALTGALIALLLTASIYMIHYGVIFLRSEMVYMALSLAALWMGIRITGPEPPSRSRALLFAATVSLTCLTRMAGLALLAALVMVFATDRSVWPRGRKRLGAAALILVLGAAGPAAWFARNRIVETEGSSSYLEEFTQAYGLDLTKNRDLDMKRIDALGMARRIATNADVFAGSCAKMLLNTNRGDAKSPLRYGLGLLCAFGLMVCLVRRRAITDYYCLAYIALYLIWPFNQQQRFYIPILPFLFEYAAISLGLLNRLLPVVFRHQGAGYLFIAVQFPLVAALLSARSDPSRADVFGLYSRPYFMFLLTVVVALVAMDICLVILRKRPGGLARLTKGVRASLPPLFILVFGALGAHEIFRGIPERHARFEALVEAGDVPEGLESIEAHPEFLELAHWIRTRTAPDAVIMCDVPKMIRIMTGRRTVPFTFSSDAGRIVETVNGLRPDYVYYSGEIGWVYQVFRRASSGMEKVFSRTLDVGDGTVLEPALYRIPR